MSQASSQDAPASKKGRGKKRSAPAAESSGKEEKGLAAAAAAAAGDEPKTKKRKKVKVCVETPNYVASVRKVLKQEAHKEYKTFKLSKRYRSCVNQLVQELYDRVQTRAAQMCKLGERQTITDREFITALKFILPRELANKAIESGRLALQRYEASRA